MHRAGISYADMMKTRRYVGSRLVLSVGTKLCNKRLCENISFEIAIGTVATSRRVCVTFANSLFLSARAHAIYLRNSYLKHFLFLCSQVASTEISVETRV